MAAVSLARSLATALFSLSLALLLARSPSSAHGAHLRGESLPAACWKSAERVCTMRCCWSKRSWDREQERAERLCGMKEFCACARRLHSATSGRSGQKCCKSVLRWVGCGAMTLHRLLARVRQNLCVPERSKTPFHDQKLLRNSWTRCDVGFGLLLLPRCAN